MTTRKPISNYKVSDSFNISIFRATVTTTKTISSIISVSNSVTVSEPGVSYLSVHYSPFSKIKFLGGVPKPIDNIILGVNGEIIEKSTKDDFFHIRTYCKWVSAKYLTKTDNDIELVGDDIPFAATVSIPLELMIIKRNDIVYFIFITPIDPKKDVPNFGIDFLR